MNHADTANTSQALFAPTIQPATNTLTLPLWRLPDARRDRDWRLAVLFRNICFQDACRGCEASNEWFAHELSVTESTIKRQLALLKQCGLIEIDYRPNGSRIRIRPLASLVEAMRSGWKMLCLVVLDRENFPAPLRRLAAAILKMLQGSAPVAPDLAKLGLSAEDVASSRSGEKCAPSAPGIAPPLSFIREKQKGQQTELAPVTLAQSVSVDPVAVSLLREGGLPEVDVQSIAIEASQSGWSLERVRQAVKAAAALASSLRNPGGFVRAALRGGWLPPAPPSNHPSDRGERPVRYVRAPDWFLQREAEARFGNLPPAEPVPAELSPKQRLEMLRKDANAHSETPRAGGSNG